MTGSGRPPTAHAALLLIWKQWTLCLLAFALALAGAVVWRGAQVSAALQQQEQQAALREIGSAIASSLERVQTLGIPLREAVGLEPWLASQVRASPLVQGLAISLTSGPLLAQHGTPAEVLPALRGTRSAAEVEAPQPTGRSTHAWVSVAIREGDQPRTVAWLHVTGHPVSAPWLQAALSLGLALVSTAIAAWAWRLWLQRQVGAPLARIREHLSDLAAGELVRGDVAWPASGTHEVARLDQALARRWSALQQRQAELLQKLNEVRAAHFDHSVLARIDALAAPLIAAPARNPALARTSPDTARRWQRWSLKRRISTALVAGWLLVLLVLAVLQVAAHLQLGQTRTQAQMQRLQSALDQGLGQELARLDALVQPAVAQAAPATGAPLIQAVLPGAAQWWMRSGADSLTHVAADAASAPAPTPQVLLDELAGRRDNLLGLWVASDHSLQLGAGRALTLADGAKVSLVAARPLDDALQALVGPLGGHCALADHRGQAIGADPQGLVRRWQEARRQPVPPQGTASLWLLSAPLKSYSGHTLGHVVVDLPGDGSPGGLEANALTTALILACGLGLAGLTWLVRQQLKPLNQAAHAIAQLADPTAHPQADGLQLDALNQDIRQVENHLEVLRALRRSRDRQGRRQARFIRHQMMALANRLDASARESVLSDLARIESAGLHAPASTSDVPANEPSLAASTVTEVNPRFERMVDEVGVLALGFQNLVGRVGDQYQQLGQLVQELREALRVKTQFIAIQQELEIARKMQLAFLPHDFSHQPGVQLHGLTQPAREVGGDFYDFFRLDEHRLAVLVADVSGKGVPAAFFMAVSRTLMRAVAQFSTGPADGLKRLNDLLAANNDELMFVTLFYAELDTRTGALAYANAGHNPPYVVRADGAVEPVPILGDMALAVMGDMPYSQDALQLNPGDALFLYTDGVTEASSPEGHWYGEALVEQYLAQHGRQASVEAVNHGLVESVKQFEAGGAQSDDVTCLMVRYTP